jgi:hypothetical protein
MRLGWFIHLPGPFGIGGTIWRSKRRRRGYYGTLPGRKCPHNHQREDTAMRVRGQPPVMRQHTAKGQS